jgi:hypothetical protein
MLIYCERKTLLNGWLILADKIKRTGDFQLYRMQPKKKAKFKGSLFVQMHQALLTFRRSLSRSLKS